MAASVEIIKEGYSSFNSELDIMKSNCTCTFVKESDKLIIVDTLTAWDKDFLQAALKKICVNCDDITHVVCTHGHSDHVGNLNLFTKATHIVGRSISYEDEYTFHPFAADVPYKISENISVISTPGHTLSDVSVVVSNTAYGTVAVAGDLFENESDITDPSIWRTFAGSENEELQFINREKILNLADVIIPGHGPMFKVTENMKSLHASQKNIV